MVVVAGGGAIGGVVNVSRLSFQLIIKCMAAFGEIDWTSSVLDLTTGLALLVPCTPSYQPNTVATYKSSVYKLVH